MNKKLFLGMLAAAGVLFSTSCSKNELDSGLSKNQAEITFSLTAEDGIATRANISDGTKADVLVYAVFDKDGKRLSGIEAVRKPGVTFPTTENIILAKGQTYKVAFWAQDEDCKAYTVDTDKMTVSVNYEGANNDETRDAFFRTVEFTVTGSTSIDVEMRRPFAQINVGVTNKDWKDAVASGIKIDQSKVVIKNAATTLNLLDGTVGDNVVNVTYDLSTIPAETLMVDTDNDGIKEKYHWLSMSYILPYDTQDGYSKTTLENIAFEFAPENNAYSHIYFNQGLNNVPVQRNWRTNILGRLLTGDITFNIVIDPVYENDHNVMTPYATIGGTAYASFAEAMAAVKDGETIKLEGETTLQGIADSKLFTVNKNITIDLNGYGFVANMPDVTQNSSIFEVDKDGELTITGDGNVKFVTKAAPNCLAAFINNIGGTVNLKGGNWTISEIGDYALIPTFVDNNSNTSNVTLNIYDGTYTFNRNLFRNFANAAGHNNYATKAVMNIYGGTFNGRESDAGAIWNQKPSSNSNIPADAGVINFEGGTLNNVVIIDEFAGVVYVNSQNELNEALKNVNIHTIMLGAGTYDLELYNTDGTNEKNSLTIIGKEDTEIEFSNLQVTAHSFNKLTISNCEILKMSDKGWGHIVFGSSNNADGVYTIENCTFNGVGTQGIYINEQTSGATYNIKNCTFNGDFGSKDGAITIQNNKGVKVNVNVTDCTFNNIPSTSHDIYVFYDDPALNLVVDGKVTAAQPSQLAAILTSDAEEIFVSLNNDITVPITSLGNQTAGSGEYKLGGESTKKITIDLNGKKLNISTTYWSAIGAKNNGATITIKNGTMTSTGNSAGTWNAWDVRLSNCNYIIEDVIFEKEVALDNAGKSTTMKNVTINGTGDKYALWITAEGQKVTIDNLTVNSAGRGIKIDEQYVDAPSKVTMSISNSKFTTANKAAVIVKSPAGAEINWGAGNDISNVAADKVFAVWVDEDAKDHAELVVVNGAMKKVEGDNTVASAATTEELAAAVSNGANTIYLTKGEFTLPNGISNASSITFVGSGNDTVVGMPGNQWNNNALPGVYAKSGAKVVFKNMTYKTNNSYMTGSIGDAESVTFEECNIIGGYHAMQTNKFIGCTIDPLNDYIYTYAGNCTFEDCDFNSSNGKALQVYSEMSGAEYTIDIKDCTFTTSVQATTWDGKPVTAIDINSINSNKFTVNITSTTATGYPTGLYSNSSLWNIKGGESDVTVVIDGNQQ